MSIKSKLIPLMLLFSSLQQVHAVGLDLNPALRDCILSGWDCLSNTGVKFIDEFFSRENGDMSYYETYEWRQYYYNSQQYWDFDHSPGPSECRRAKEELYLQSSGYKPYPSGSNNAQREEHLQGYRQVKGRDIFECSEAWRKIFTQHKIGKRN